MPYTIRKQKCKQSDGDTGSYVLSYADNSGKKHSNCHTSKKKAQGQIAAIEGQWEADETGAEEEVMTERLLREMVREMMTEAPRGKDKATKGDKAPKELKPIIKADQQTAVIRWDDFVDQMSGEDKRLVQDVIDKGPVASNANGEPAVCAVMNFLAGTEAFVAKGGSAKADIECVKEVRVTVGGIEYFFPPGFYEVKEQGDAGSAGLGGKLARLGQAKAYAVAAVEPIGALSKIGSIYSSKILGRYSDEAGNIVDEDGNLGDLPLLLQALETMVRYFEGTFTGAQLTRWYGMQALELGQGAVGEIKAGIYDDLKRVADAIASALGAEVPAGDKKRGGKSASSNTVKIVSDEGMGAKVTYEFDPLVWYADVSRILNRKKVDADRAGDDELDMDYIRGLVEALKDVWSVISENLPYIKKLQSQEFWDTLAVKSQERLGILGIFTVAVQKASGGGKGSAGFRFFTFPELTTMQITQNGRLVLAPISEALVRDYVRTLISS